MTTKSGARLPERTMTTMTPNRRPIDLAEYGDAHLATTTKQALWEEPGPGVEPMLTTTIRLPKTVLDALRSAAAARGVKVTTLMREWLGERLAQADADPDAAIPVSALLALVAERATSAPRIS